MIFGTGFEDKNGNRRKKFGIVGFAESSRHLAPFDDDSWMLAGMNQLYRHIPRADAWYEIHTQDQFEEDIVPGTDYHSWLKTCPIPIYMVDKFPWIPSSVKYPIDERVNQFGDYFYSTISYMIADAIAWGMEEIGIWGVDLAHDSEYEYQKPSAEYLLGYAKGLGIKVTLPPQSALLKGTYRYGYSRMPSNEDVQWLKVYHERVNGKLQEIIGMCNQFQGQIALAQELGATDKIPAITEELNRHIGVCNQLQGQVNCAAEFLSWARSKRRGSAPPPDNGINPDVLASAADQEDKARISLVK